MAKRRVLQLRKSDHGLFKPYPTKRPGKALCETVYLIKWIAQGPCRQTHGASHPEGLYCCHHGRLHWETVHKAAYDLVPPLRIKVYVNVRHISPALIDEPLKQETVFYRVRAFIKQMRH